MLRTYKLELNPVPWQRLKIRQSMGVCRWLYNAYLAKNQELYTQFREGLIDKKAAFMSANAFDKYINHEIKTLETHRWIDECGSKARKKAIVNAETAYKRFFKKQSGFPHFKKKGRSDITLYFPKNNPKDWLAERHRLKIPTLGWVRLKEFGYLPANPTVISGTISERAGRYYVAVVCEVGEPVYPKPEGEPLGIDLGLTNFAILSNGLIQKNINRAATVRKLEKRLRHEQRSLSRKYESLKTAQKNKKEGESTRQNIQRQTIKVQKVHQRLSNIRTDYVNKCIAEIVGQKPSSITIEDLDVKGMMKDRHQAKAIANQRFSEFRTKLTHKCRQNGIELRVADRWFPSSKTCSCCGTIKRDLKRSDRTYICSTCGLVIDRDLQASINLRETKIYRLAV